MQKRIAPAADRPPNRLRYRSLVSQVRQETLLIALVCGILALVEMQLPLNHDVAWLLDAGSRWWHGEQLYVDLIEVNPPLVFYLYGLISLGTWTKAAFIIGIVTSIGLTGLWTRRLKGEWWGIATVIIAVAAGAVDFGQRDHIAAIFAIPYLFAGRANRAERILIGVWAFAGFGLKPHLLIIPAATTLGRILQEGSLRPAHSPENLALGSLCVTYLAIAWMAYPVFFQQMVPLGNLVYFAYGVELNSQLPVNYIVAFSAVIVAFGSLKRTLWPSTAAVVGAFISFFVQGRFWTYHLVPALALTAILSLLLVQPQSRQFAIVLCLTAIAGTGMFLTKQRQYADIVPRDATSVLFLTAHVPWAYPAVMEHGVKNASHYPALWTLPGAWRLYKEPSTDPSVRRQAIGVLLATRETVIGDILKYCPDPIFVDVRPVKPYFKYPFDFEKFILADPRVRNYRPGNRQGSVLPYVRTHPCGA